MILVEGGKNPHANLENDESGEKAGRRDHQPTEGRSSSAARQSSTLCEHFPLRIAVQMDLVIPRHCCALTPKR
jgi:hypothetical protein